MSEISVGMHGMTLSIIFVKGWSSCEVAGYQVGIQPSNIVQSETERKRHSVWSKSNDSAKSSWIRTTASADPTSNDEPRVVQTGDHTPHSPSAPLAPFAVFPAVPSHPCPVAPTQSARLTDAAGQTYHPMPDVWHPDRQHNPQQPLPQTIHQKNE
ncbi:hypothetical protein BLNAU_6869 [Blattamonas nauphoetae]|uniref:Uncharacterized protein n=1 Tax=Blattamonas nauphoetae TaxID=2049346 RepID=A0ABQ9Y349_9EUKA|nr:hypothetical protein BLNAU_6869 [Blattamonas nauphoetae]